MAPADTILIDNMQSGLLFQKLGPALYSSNSYSVVVRYNFTLLKKQDEKLEESFKELTKYLANHSKTSEGGQGSMFLGELNLLHSEMTEYEEEMEALLELIPVNSRKGRSICDGLGRIISSITGLMDDEDRSEMEAAKKRVQGHLSELKMEVTAKKIVIRDILEDTLNNTKALGMLARDVCTNNGIVQKMENWVLADGKLRELGFWVSKLKIERAQIRIGIESVIRKVLSPELLSPDRLFQICKVKKFLEPGLELGFPLKMQNLQAFYEMSQVRLRTQQSELSVTIDFPLRKVGGSFQISKLIPIPIFHSGLGHMVKFLVHDYLIISQDFKYYKTLNEEELRTCVKIRELTICPARSALSSSVVKSCEFEMFSGRGSQKCEKEILPFEGNFLLKIGARHVSFM